MVMDSERSRRRDIVNDCLVSMLDSIIVWLRCLALSAVVASLYYVDVDVDVDGLERM